MTRLRTVPAIACAALVPTLGALAESLRDVPVHRAGTEFELRFELSERAFPIVVHVDPVGRVAVVHPAGDVDVLPPVAAGDGISVPDPESGLVWSLSGDPGYETFILVACASPDVDLVMVSAEASAAADASKAGGRAEVVAAVETYLSESVGPIRSATILHLP